MVDWDKVSEKWEGGKGRARGTYVLTDKDRRKLEKLLESTGGVGNLPVEDVKEVFYRGKRNPKANAMVATLNKRFEGEYKFGVADKNRRISITKL